ncbi:MAG: hypothetical protein L6V93_13655 [Clostridiales bacterium]|nr:MAG: hypothetical protein L6V93_13655 [Clostridiales bacterium]
MSRATLHNLDYIRQKDIKKSATECSFKKPAT